MDLFTPSISFMHSPCHLFLLYYNFIKSTLCSRPRARHREDTSSFIPFPWCLHDTACMIFICVHVLHKSLKLVPKPNLSVSQASSWGNTPGRLHRYLWKLNLTCVPKAGRGWRRWNLAKLTGVKPKAPAVSSKAIWTEASWSVQQGRRRATVKVLLVASLRTFQWEVCFPGTPTTQDILTPWFRKLKVACLWGPPPGVLGGFACGSSSFYSVQSSVPYFLYHPEMKGISAPNLLNEEDRKWNEIWSQVTTPFSNLKTVAEQMKDIQISGTCSLCLNRACCWEIIGLCMQVPLVRNPGFFGGMIWVSAQAYYGRYLRRKRDSPIIHCDLIWLYPGCKEISTTYRVL